MLTTGACAHPQILHRLGPPDHRTRHLVFALLWIRKVLDLLLLVVGARDLTFLILVLALALVLDRGVVDKRQLFSSRIVLIVFRRKVRSIEHSSLTIQVLTVLLILTMMLRLLLLPLARRRFRRPLHRVLPLTAWRARGTCLDIIPADAGTHVADCLSALLLWFDVSLGIFATVGRRNRRKERDAR